MHVYAINAYICKHKNIRTHTLVYVHVHVYVYIYIYIYIYTHICAYIHALINEIRAYTYAFIYGIEHTSGYPTHLWLSNTPLAIQHDNYVMREHVIHAHHACVRDTHADIKTSWNTLLYVCDFAGNSRCPPWLCSNRCRCWQTGRWRAWST